MEPKKKREIKKFWAVCLETHDMPEFVTGYSCAPENPHYWWCPQLGYSLSDEHDLFATEQEALQKAISKVQDSIHRQQSVLDKLNKRLLSL